MVKGFDEKFYMYGVRQIITAALFSGEAVVSQSFIEQSSLFSLTLLATVAIYELSV